MKSLLFFFPPHSIPLPPSSEQVMDVGGMSLPCFHFFLPSIWYNLNFVKAHMSTLTHRHTHTQYPHRFQQEPTVAGCGQGHMRAGFLEAVLHFSPGYTRGSL